MSKQFWRVLQAEAPRALALCLAHFQERYPGSASAQLLATKPVIDYLYQQGYSLQISQFGIPNRQDWYYEVHTGPQLLRHQRGFASRTLATQAAFRFAFLHLEARQTT
jgi:hypothetical protein